MGLLDDAIREHLELKRRHGADPGEIERQEHEAFGAGRREDVDLVDGPAGEAPVDVPAEAPGAFRAEDFAADAATTAYVPPDVEPDEVEPPAGEEELPAPGQEAAAPGYDEDPWLDEDEDAPREPGASGPEPEAGPEGSAVPPGEDDVLEETPDFLQETPEHDRLWFEQKPPRDFDWDR